VEYFTFIHENNYAYINSCMDICEEILYVFIRRNINLRIICFYLVLSIATTH